MELKYIIEICVAIDIAILGIAYPIIVDKISNIGEKFSSNYLSEIFNDEFPQKGFSKKRSTFSSLKLVLYSTIISFIFLIFSIPPLFETHNMCLDWILGNSAKLIVLTLSTLLTITFFYWLDLVFIYNGKSTTILKRTIKKYKAFNKECTLKTYHLKTINEFAIYAIQNSDKHLQKTLLEFYYSEVSSLRKAHDVNYAFEYPNEFYEFVYNLISELVIQENVKLTAIEHRAVSANWFLSPDFRAITISETTYTWLWRNLCLIVEKEKYVKKYWSTANQHFSYQLRRIDEIWNREGKIINESEVEKRDKERLVYLEFQYAFGGLLLYSKQFETIKYILSYSQSLPPDYVLLPKDMTDVFYWFEEFRNEFKERVTPIDLKFYFPGLDNLGNNRQVNYWICSFVTILFIRQFSLHKYYEYQDFTSLPKLPNSIIELENWYEGISFFKKCLQDIISNSELISQLGYAVLLEKKEDELLKYADNLKIALQMKIGEEKLNAPISDEKIQAFNKKTAEIIKKSFDNYSIIHNTIEIYSPETVSYIKVKLNGYNSLFSKSAFTDNDISSLNYDSVLAGAIARETINYLIPGSFLISRTNRYLLSDENIIEGIRKLKIKKNEFVIVAINLYQHVEDKLDEYKEILLKVQSTNRKVQNTIFVLRKIDLPFIIHEDLPEKEIMENELIQINDELKLYTSVVELKGDEQNQNWEDIINPNDIEVNVKVSIAFLSYIVWKKDKKIVQINIETPYDEQGIPNTLDDIKPF